MSSARALTSEDEADPLINLEREASAPAQMAVQHDVHANGVHWQGWMSIVLGVGGRGL